MRCEVTLYLNERKMSVMALMDTGNLLCDPVSGDPVSILDHEFYEKFREQQQKEGSVLRDTEPKMRYIPLSEYQWNRCNKNLPNRENVCQHGRGKMD